jgi:lipopolysaccharide assembly outer membrane protein LptD (OstA)
MRFPNAGRADFVSQDPDVYFEGELIEKRGPKQYVVTRGHFSTCVQPTPRWEVGGKKFTINLDQYVIATNMVLEVKGVPLLYLPALYYPIHSEGRSTGFLMPSFGTSTFRGTTLSNAFFWAIGGARTPRSSTTGSRVRARAWGRNTAISAASARPACSGSTASTSTKAVFDQNNTTTTLPAQTSYQMNGAVNHNLGHGLRAQGNVEYFSDVSTQQLYQQNTYERSSSRRTVAGGLTGVFGPATFGGYYSRSEQFNDTRNSTVYGSTPRATANIARRSCSARLSTLL